MPDHYGTLLRKTARTEEAEAVARRAQAIREQRKTTVK